MARAEPDPMDKRPKVSAPPTEPSKPRKGMKDYGTTDEMVEWHNMPYAERLKLLRAGKAPSFVAVSSVDSRLKYLAQLIAMQQQGLLPGKNKQPGPNEKPPVGLPTPSTPSGKSTAGTDNVQAQLPPWLMKMTGTR